MEEKQSTAWCWTRNYRFQQHCRSPMFPGITTTVTSAVLSVRCGWRAPADMSTLWDGRETLPGSCEAAACQA